MSSGIIDKEVIMSSVFWKVLERFMTQGINLLIQIVLARILIPSTFGELAIIMSLVMFANVFAQSGLSISIIQRKNLDQEDINVVFTASTAISFLVYLILFIISCYIEDYYSLTGLKNALRVLGLVLFLNVIYSIENALLVRNMKFKVIALRSMFAIPISGLIGVILAYNGFGIWALVTMNLINIFITVIVLMTNLKLKLNFSFNIEKFKEIYRFSGKILLANLMTCFHDSLRNMLIGKVFSPSSLAFYDKAYTYVGYVSELAKDSVSSVLLPAFSQKQDEIPLLKDMARKSMRITAFVMFPTLITFAASARNIVVLVLTDKWIDSVPFIVLFCFLRIPSVIKTIDFQVFYATGKSEINLLYCSAFFIINMALLFISLRFGLIEIAIAAVIAEYLSLFVIAFIGSNLYNYNLKERFDDIFITFVNAICTGIFVYMLQFMGNNSLRILTIQFVSSLLIYLTLEYLFDRKNVVFILESIKTKILHNTTSIIHKHGE